MAAPRRKTSRAGKGRPGSLQVLSRLALNRALLARQMLLERQATPVPKALEHLVGLQAQSPTPPYFGLWKRLQDFRAEDLSELIESRKVVRISLMRSTIHLVTARDALRLRPLMQALHEKQFFVGSRHGAAVEGVDIAEALKLGRALVEATPLTFTAIGAELAKRWPGRPHDSLGYILRNHLAMVQVPPRGLWRRSGPPAHTTIEAWLGRSIGTDTSPDRMVLRYVAAFGPASVRDAQAWSGLPKLGDVFERIGRRLVRFRDEAGRELFDLPDAPRPDPDTPAPVRFLPEFDNILLSHADRTRIVSDDDRRRLQSGGGILPATILVDGFVHGTWKILRKGKSATLEIAPFRPLSRKAVAALTAEGERLLEFAAPDAGARAVRLASA